MKKLPIEWTEEVEEETGLTLEDFFRGHLENALEAQTIQNICTNYKDNNKDNKGEL